MANKNWQKISDEIDIIVDEHFSPKDPWKDGIIDTAKYSNAKLRILWILKEPYDEGCDGREDKRNKKTIEDFGKSQKTFKPMIYTSWGILNDFRLWGNMDNVEDNPSMLDALKSTAFINISKIEGDTKSPPKRIAEFYEENKEILLKQIKAYEPNVIIDCSRLPEFGIIKEIIKENEENKSIKYNHRNNVLYIQSPHPAQRKTKQENYCNKIILIAEKYFSEKSKINESIRIFKNQLESIAAYLKLDIEYPKDLCYEGSSVIFKINKNVKYSISIGFDSNFNDFYYGIYNLDKSYKLPTEIVEKCTESFGEPEGTTEYYTWCKYFKEYKDWNVETLAAIQSGTLAEEIKKIVEVFLNILGNDL